MPQFRVTKYNPKYRDSSGAYTRDDWTSYSQVGQACSGKRLTLEEYQQVESAYINAAVAFMQEAAIQELVVRGLETAPKYRASITEGLSVKTAQLSEVLRALLRNQYWCRLEGHAAYVHVGYDFYMYVGVPTACPAAEATSKQSGLFVEALPSPYSESAA
jgi:hypothetical protein